MRKKTILFYIFVLFVSLNVFALDAVYDFNIEGKTKVQSLKEKMEIPDMEYFASIDEAVEKFDYYRQQMINLRVFTSVEYKYTQSGNTLDVLFDIVDAKTFLGLPYPKYDSNSGLSIRVKAIEKNFLGTLAEIGGGFEFRKANKQFSAGFEVTSEEISLGSVAVAGSFDTMVNFSSFKETTLGFDITAKTKYKDITIKPQIILNIPGFDADDKTEIIIATGFEDINLLSTDISVKPSIRILGGKLMYLRNELSAEYSKFVLTDDFIFYSENSENAIDNQVDFGYKVTDNLFPYLELNNYIGRSGNNLKYIEIAANVRYENKYKNIGYEAKIGDAQRIYTNSKDKTNYVVASFTAGKSDINYTVGNFRTGVAFSLTTDLRHGIKKNDSNAFNYFRIRGQVTWFPLDNEIFNPSVRITASCSTVPFGYYDHESDGFGFDYNDSSSASPLLAEYMRGIKDSNSTAKNITNQKAFVNANINLMFKFISVGKSIETYINPFCDITIMCTKPKSIKEVGVSTLTTRGFEGIGVLKKYPAYPFRLSLGVDLDSLCNWLNTKQGKPDYEIYIGLYHFF